MLTQKRIFTPLAANGLLLLVLNGCSGSGGQTTTLPSTPVGAAAAESAALAPPTATTVAATNRQVLTQTRSAAGAAAPAGEIATSSDGFVDTIGVNTHLWWGAYAQNFAVTKGALTTLGVRHIRDGMVWVDWGTGYYDQLNALAAAGIKATLTTALGQDPQKIATYVGFVPTALEAIEGPNEPNAGATTSAWVAPNRAFQQALYTAVRANPANAKVSVISSAIANTDAQYAVLGNLSPYLDAGNIHDYFGGNTPDSSWIAARMAAAGAVSGSKPIVATETGYCTATGNQAVPESIMAKYVPRAFFEQYNAGVTRTLEYELIDDSTNTADYWSQCGLLHYDFTPKPAYTALKNLIALLNDRTTPAPRTQLAYTLLGNTQAVHHTLLQKNDGSFYLALWLAASDFDQNTHAALTVPPQPIAVNFGSPVASLQAYTYDVNGNLTAKTIPVNQNSAQISVTDTVTILKIVRGAGTVAPNVAPVVLNPAAHWSFDEGTGGVVADSVSSAGNAAFNHAAAWTSGIFGSAAALSPTVALHAPGGIIDTSQSYSVSAWLMLADTSVAHNAIAIEGTLAPAFALGYVPGHGFGFLLNARDANWQNTYIRAYQSATPVIGTWYAVTATFDKPSCRISLYVNGTLTQTVPGCTTFAAAGQVDFGSGLYQTWSGAVDEVNFYARVLTPAEITLLAQK